MNNSLLTSGVILAGGLARRMNNQDKGLLAYQGKPLVSYAISAAAQVLDDVMISANRHLEQYRCFNWPVLTDQTDSFDGPLAGVLTAMRATHADVLLVLPCDCPLVTAAHLRHLINTRINHDADIAVAFDGERLHPVFLALKTDLQDSLASYLESGQRKVEHWIKLHHCVKADFSGQAELFININSMAELSALESLGLHSAQH